MTEAVLPIQVESSPDRKGAIEIGFDKRQLEPDGFRVDVTADEIRITGGNRKGAIYAVVDILEKTFGCRCYSPTVRVFPKHATLTIASVSYTENPVNAVRTVNGDFTASEDWLDWQRLSSTGEMFGNGFYVHTFHRLVPPERYLSSHPEYFALIGGRRTPSQLCPSRPENIEIAVETLKKEMASQPDKSVWSVSQNDNEEYCHCPECLKTIEEEGSPAGPILRFVNAVARRFPDKTISTLAYEYSRTAPKRTKPDPNVQIMLCTIELTRSNPIAVDPTCAGFRKDIVDWGKICHNIYLWDYTVDFAHQVSPFPNIHVLQPNIQFFVHNNARQHFQQSNTSPGHEFSELKSYLLARLLWNPNANAKAIVHDFLSGYFGAAAKPIHEYIAKMEANLQRSGARLDIFGRPTAHQNGFLSAEAVAQYNELFDRAEIAVANSPELFQRVKVARLPLLYATLAIAADNVFSPRGFFEDVNGIPKLRQNMANTLEEFAKTCANNNVRSVNESNLKPTEFCDAIRGMLHLEIDGNLAFRKPVVANPPPAPKYGHGDIGLLTNGIRGSNDFGVQWLGWEGVDFDLTLDLGAPTFAHEAILRSLSEQRSWILHPKSIACNVSTDGSTYTDAGRIVVEDDPKNEPLLKTFAFQWTQPNVRYIRLHVESPGPLPAWHAGAGGKCWIFLDELVVH